jgi:hypothetical protein
VTATPLVGVHRDRHRLRHGSGLAPRDAPGSARRQGLTKSVEEVAGFGQYGVVDHVARFEQRRAIGYGSTSRLLGRVLEVRDDDAYSGAS